MAAELYYRSAGTWRKMKEIHYRSAGTWYKLKEVWYKSAGTWRKVYAGIVYGAGTGAAWNFDGVTHVQANDDIIFLADGTVSTAALISPGTWATGNVSGTAHWVRFTYSSGSATTTPALPTGWIAISGSSASMTLNGVIDVVEDTWIDYQIATDSGGSNVVLSGQIHLRID